MSEHHQGTAVTDDSSKQNQNEWSLVYEAIAERWPQIDQAELRQCEQSITAITKHVSDQVESAADEVNAAVTEFAPESHSVLEPVAEKLKQASSTVGGSVSNAVERVQYEIDESPVKTSLGALAAGFALGVLATTIYARAHRDATHRRHATAWEQMRKRFGA
ncbi:hypothetical protein [Neorhodopirellula lusitana]|uniref:hypothetical protein n=1 Tax=Neorhodopirellula lusitana TaxID=445327 RepID=UPI00384B6F5D